MTIANLQIHLHDEREKEMKKKNNFTQLDFRIAFVYIALHFFINLFIIL